MQNFLLLLCLDRDKQLINSCCYYWYVMSINKKKDLKNGKTHCW